MDPVIVSAATVVVCCSALLYLQQQQDREATRRRGPSGVGSGRGPRREQEVFDAIDVHTQLAARRDEFRRQTGFTPTQFQDLVDEARTLAPPPTHYALGLTCISRVW